MAVGGLALILLIVAFRPFARSGAIAYAQSNLRAAAAAARTVGEQTGSLASANRVRMGTEPSVDNLLFIDPDTSSNDSEIISVDATERAWTGAARADTGECYWIRIERGGSTVHGTGTDCSAEEARAAPAGTWPTS
jgi:hypothetical protein